jgi:hypothetical protein
MSMNDGSNVTNEKPSTQLPVTIKDHNYNDMFRLEMVSHFRAVSTKNIKRNHIKLCALY